MTSFTNENNFLTMGFEWEASGSTTEVRRALRDAGIDWVKVESEHCGVEVVFPPFPMPMASSTARDDIKSVLELFSGLNVSVENGNNCGGHVHLGNVAIENMPPQAFWEASKDAMRGGDFISVDDQNRSSQMPAGLLKDVIRRYALHQPQISEHLPPSRSRSTWAMPIDRLAPSGRDHRAFEAADTIESIHSVLHRNGSRYHAICLERAWNNGTIEFRQGASLCDIDRLAGWLELIHNLFIYSDHYRLDHDNSGMTVIQSPERIHRRGSRLDVVYQMCRTIGGATTRDIMDATGNTAGDVRRMISEIRNHADMETDLLETLTQQHYNHRYGESGGAYDLGGYAVHTEIERGNGITQLLPDNRIGQTSIFANLDDASFEALTARRLERIERGTLNR